MRQGLAAGRVGDGDVVSLGRRRPSVVDEEVELSLARIEPGDGGVSGFGCGSVGEGLEERG